MNAVDGKRRKLTGQQRKEQIMRTATEVFARRGFASTTMKQLARRAGVSEAMIYHHFAGKEELYGAILERRIEDCRHLFFPLEAARSKDDRAVLETIISNFLQHHAEDSSFFRMVLFSALEGHDLADRYVRGPVREFYSFLGPYLEDRMRDGVFRGTNGQLAARLLIGMAHHAVLMKEVFKDPLMENVENEDLVTAVVDLFCNGLKVDGAGGKGDEDAPEKD